MWRAISNTADLVQVLYFLNIGQIYGNMSPRGGLHAVQEL